MKLQKKYVYLGRACDVGMTYPEDEDDESIFRPESSYAATYPPHLSNITGDTTVQV